MTIKPIGYKKIPMNKAKQAIDDFTDGKLKLYTPKNQEEFIVIVSIDDAIRYMYRLYTKE